MPLAVTSNKQASVMLLATIVERKEIQDITTWHAKPLGKRFAYPGEVHSLASCATAVGASVAGWRASSMKART